MKVKKLIVLVSMLVSLNYADTLHVDVHQCAPLTMEKDGEFSGLEIDLIKRIANDNNYQVKFNKVENFTNIFDGLKSGKADVAIAALSVTAGRERVMDFSHSYMTTGLGVMFSKDKNKIVTDFKSNVIFYLGLIKSLLPFLLAWTIYVYTIAFILWLLERKSELFNHDMKDGWMDSKFFVHVVMSSTGFGNQIPTSKWGKRITVLIMYSGIGFMFPLITSKISSEMQKKAPTSYINEVSDLKDKKIAVIDGTTSLSFVKKYEGVPVIVKSIEEATEALQNKRCDAVIHDKPSLQYISQSDSNLVILDKTLTIEQYGIGIQNNSQLAEMFNTSILSYIESGYIKNLSDIWLR